MYQRDELLLIRVLENFQPVLDAEGYAECPDCEARIHCGTVGLANLEKRHRGTKTCLETKAKRDKNAKTTRNGSLLTFFNRPKPSLVPSTISTVQPVQSLALAQEKEPNSKSATVALGDGQPQAPIITRPRVSLFLEKFDYLAKNLPHTIPEASDSDRLAEIQPTLMIKPLEVMTCGRSR